MAGLRPRLRLISLTVSQLEPMAACISVIEDNRRIRRVSPDGIITTVAGNGTAGFSGDGGPAPRLRLITLTVSQLEPMVACISVIQITVEFAG